MKLQGFLDQLLQSAQGAAGQAMARTGTSAAAGLPASSGGLGSMLNADFGKGALSGGALGLLLGKNRTTRKLATYGGLAAIGVMAYRAYGDYKRQQLGAVAPGEPQTLDRLPPLEVEQHSQAVLRALVAAAKADGHIDTRERELIEGEFTRLNGDEDVQRWLHAELEKPLDPAEVAQAATTPEIASEMYLASLLAADAQSFMERSYLDELARQLGIDDSLKQHLQRQAAAHAG
ncbi:tellurite resistance TerB family protein [Xanthomonas translucens]|uniref:tellurite resistance TerB family protein n=1 Tax=Xanthomonas campestris pv. translucens TaxID=343 RepID=UPI001F305CEF|nr:tellurite resistance TerB family protein [Xanthomonas translucens]UKE51915.1 tellurite resistance TerB family protein [Xanthomonas translucens]